MLAPLARPVLSVVAATALLSVSSALAAPLVVTLNFPGGFDVSINDGPLTPSGPILMTGILDDSTVGSAIDEHHFEFPLTSVTLSGAGFVNAPVTTPLSLLTYDVFAEQQFAFQRSGQFNEGIAGWNGPSTAGPFMADIQDLSTLFPLPYETTGFSTFWYDALGSNAWTLVGGDTIGADLGIDGPAGIFSISRVPEPSSALLFVLGTLGFLAVGHRARTFA